MSEPNHWDEFKVYHPKELCIVGQEIYKLRQFEFMGQQINYSINEFPRDHGDKWERVTNSLAQ
jgi:hypothetical protein